MVHIYFQIKRHSGGEHGNNNFGIIFGVFLIAAGLADIHDEKMASLTFWVDVLIILIGALFMLGVAKFISRKKNNNIALLGNTFIFQPHYYSIETLFS